MPDALTIFTTLPDPRAANSRHRIGDMVLIALAATLCGGQTCVDFAQFAQSKKTFLEQVLGPFEPPSHDTFSRLFRLLDPEALATALATFSETFHKHVNTVVAIDGKALRRAIDAGRATSPPMMITAWAVEARLALAAVTPHPNGPVNEVEAAIAAVELLDLKGCIVTGDALHTNRKLAEAVIERSGDYALVVKGNRPKLKALCEHALSRPDAEIMSAWTETKAHGRNERRSVRAVALEQNVKNDIFPQLRMVAEVTSSRDQAAPKRRYIVFSKVLSPEEALRVTRAHWGIENTLHWSLDVTLREDDLRARRDNAPGNIAVLNRIAMNMLSLVDDPKTSRRGRIKRCAWEDQYLLNALGHMQ